MRSGKGPGRLLLVLELAVLAVVLVFTIVKKVNPKKEEEWVSPRHQDIAWSEPEEAEESEPEAEPEIEEAVFSPEISERLAAMTLEEKTAQMFLTTPESLTGTDGVTIAGEGTRNALNQYPVGGLLYAQHHFRGRTQANLLFYKAQTYSKERLDTWLFLAARDENDTESVKLLISDRFDAAPMTDLLASGNIQQGSEEIQAALMLSDELDNLLPETAWVMAEEFTDETKAALRQLGYKGLVVSEPDMAADAVPGEAAIRAIQSGVDMVCQLENFPESYQAVLDAAERGEISVEQIDRAVGRILEKKLQIPDPEVVEEPTPQPVQSPEQPPVQEATPQV